MPTIVFSDGRRGKVPYNKAAYILEVLNGNKEPESPEQEAYIGTIDDIIFEPPISKKRNNFVSNPALKARIAAIRADKSLKGYAVYEAMRAAYKENMGDQNATE
jgi:hypothetical protein